MKKQLFIADRLVQLMTNESISLQLLDQAGFNLQHSAATCRFRLAHH